MKNHKDFLFKVVSVHTKILPWKEKRNKYSIMRSGSKKQSANRTPQTH